jgi:uncharacterized protein (DUF1810 family)
MLTLRPAPDAEPASVAKARAVLRLSIRHPDAHDAAQALDVIAHAMMRLREIEARMEDPALRESISSEPYGMLSCLSDAVSDFATALDAWHDDSDDRAHRARLDARRI